ncbi:MAG: YraN family protein [Coprococcus sp.]|nr:YraN family protein [Coprococcus sp.]
MNTRKTGSYYEKVAGAFLEKKGYQIWEYNFHCPYAEIDIVARDGEYLVFCEVKYRCHAEEAQPLEAVDRKKQKRISRAALFYITQRGYADIPCRFDVIGITEKEIILVQNAFDYVGE